MANGEGQRKHAPKAPRPPSGPLQGCHRCRGGGVIDVLLSRRGHLPTEYAVRCECPASANYAGLSDVNRFVEGWGQLGATVVEWPTARQRAEC
jgi:hypothetical protein